MKDPGSPSKLENWRPLALLIVGIAAIMVFAIRLIPYEDRMPNFAPAGAMFLFVGARLKPGRWYLFPFALLILIDVYFLSVKGWKPSPFVYAGYGLYLGLGYLVSRTESPLKVGPAAVIGSFLFFLVSNFGVWLQHIIMPDQYVSAIYQYPADLSGLFMCYEMALPFYRGTILSDLMFTGAFFAAHAVFARVYFPAEVVATPAKVEVDS